jgi:hypothetical protein
MSNTTEIERRNGYHTKQIKKELEKQKEKK